MRQGNNSKGLPHWLTDWLTVLIIIICCSSSPLTAAAEEAAQQQLQQCSRFLEEKPTQPNNKKTTITAANSERKTTHTNTQNCWSHHTHTHRHAQESHKTNTQNNEKNVICLKCRSIGFSKTPCERNDAAATAATETAAEAEAEAAGTGAATWQQQQPPANNTNIRHTLLGMPFSPIIWLHTCPCLEEFNVIHAITLTKILNRQYVK